MVDLKSLLLSVESLYVSIKMLCYVSECAIHTDFIQLSAHDIIPCFVVSRQEAPCTIDQKTEQMWEQSLSKESDYDETEFLIS